MLELLSPSLKEGKKLQNFPGVATNRRSPNYIWNKPNLFATTSLGSVSSQYAIFSKSLVNPDLFYFCDRPWYSDESVWRLVVFIWAAWVLFIFYLKQKQRFWFSNFTDSMIFGIHCNTFFQKTSSFPFSEKTTCEKT